MTLRVQYYGYSEDIDEKVKGALAVAGFTWFSQSYNFDGDLRDIAFTYEEDEDEQ